MTGITASVATGALTNRMIPIGGEERSRITATVKYEKIAPVPRAVTSSMRAMRCTSVVPMLATSPASTCLGRSAPRRTA